MAFGNGPDQGDQNLRHVGRVPHNKDRPPIIEMFVSVLRLLDVGTAFIKLSFSAHGRDAPGSIEHPGLTTLGPGHDHIGLPSATAGTDKLLAPIEDAGVGAVPSSHLCRVGLDLMLARLAPHDKPDLGSGSGTERHRGAGLGFHIGAVACQLECIMAHRRARRQRGGRGSAARCTPLWVPFFRAYSVEVQQMPKQCGRYVADRIGR
jgi:hypothetical protein